MLLLPPIVHFAIDPTTALILSHPWEAMEPGSMSSGGMIWYISSLKGLMVSI